MRAAARRRCSFAAATPTTTSCSSMACASISTAAASISAGSRPARSSASRVLRGAQSSLWGADAMTSVVQIFTKRAAATDGPQVSGSVEGGSFGTFRGNAGVNGGARGRVDYRGGVTSRRPTGAFSDLLPEDDRFTRRRFDGGAGVAIGTSRARCAAGSATATAKGHSVGPFTFGARDSGTAYDTKDLSGYVTLTHALGSRFTGTGTVNYFRYEGRSVDTDRRSGVYDVRDSRRARPTRCSRTARGWCA